MTSLAFLWQRQSYPLSHGITSIIFSLDLPVCSFLALVLTPFSSLPLSLSLSLSFSLSLSHPLCVSGKLSLSLSLSPSVRVGYTFPHHAMNNASNEGHGPLPQCDDALPFGLILDNLAWCLKNMKTRATQSWLRAHWLFYILVFSAACSSWYIYLKNRKKIS